MDSYLSLTIGSFMVLATVPCLFYYYHILSIISKDKNLRRKSSYRLMIAIGIADMITCIAHLITGLYTIFNVFIPASMGKLLGVVATPSYVMYTVLTLVLAMNRLLQVWSPDINIRLFSGPRVFIWIGVASLFWMFFAVSLAMPIATISYSLASYSWSYDESFPWSIAIKRTEMWVEVTSILLSAICYGIVMTIYAKRKSVSSVMTGQHFEKKLLVQAAGITVYCTVLNVLWHNSYLLPDSMITQVILNFMWIFNSWVYPLIYIIVNKTIRENTLARVRSVANTTTGSAPDGMSLSQVRFKKNPIERTLGAVPQTTSEDQRHKPIYIT